MGELLYNKAEIIILNGRAAQTIINHFTMYKNLNHVKYNVSYTHLYKLATDKFGSQ